MIKPQTHLIEKTIQELQELDLKNRGVDEFKVYFDRLMTGYHCVTLLLNASYVFRARKTNESNSFVQISDLWYPPPHKILRYGRLNNIGTSVFYCSDTESTALQEMRPKAGEAYTILRCRLENQTNPPHVMELGIAERASLSSHPLQHPIPENTQFGRQLLGNQENIEGNLKIRSYLHQEFTKIVELGNEHQYKTTVALAEILMNSDGIDGVCYPSIVNGVGTNLALKPTSADLLYKPDEAWVIRVEKDLGVKGFEVLCTAKSKSISAAGVIAWN